MHTRATPASIQNRPCHPVISTKTPPSKGPAAAPTAAAAPHKDTARSCAWPVLATESRLSPHAKIVDPAAPLNEPASDHHFTGVGERDQHTGQDEEQQAELENPFAPEDIAQRTRGHDHRSSDQRITGYRPLQGID
jgi:hypothetical protein